MQPLTLRRTVYRNLRQPHDTHACSGVGSGLLSAPLLKTEARSPAATCK